MSGFRIAPQTVHSSIVRKSSAPKKRKDYLSFIHSLPCVVTGKSPVEAAHLSFAAIEYGHLGRAKGRKASDRWALPLHPDEHAKQHAGNERAYWASTGINPHILALVFWGLFSDMGEEAESYCKLVIAGTTPSDRRTGEVIR